VGMPSSTLCVVFEHVPPEPKRTRSVQDGIPTQERGNEIIWNSGKLLAA
jgi:hypothetical protein